MKRVLGIMNSVGAGATLAGFSLLILGTLWSFGVSVGPLIIEAAARGSLVAIGILALFFASAIAVLHSVLSAIHRKLASRQ